MQVLAQHLRVRDALRHLAQAVHVVGEGDQARGPVVARQGAKGVAHHGGAGDLAEGAHVRQARRAIAGLQDHRALQGGKGRQGFIRLAGVDQGARFGSFGLAQPFLQNMGQQVAGLFEGPGLGLAGEGFEVLKHGGGLQSASRPVNRDQALAAITMISTL